jgi:hypothetical protein
MKIALHFATLVHALRPLDSVMTEQFHYSRLVMKRCTKIKLPDNNLRDVTACYFSKQHPLSKSFPEGRSYNLEVAVNYDILAAFKNVLKFVQIHKQEATGNYLPANKAQLP